MGEKKLRYEISEHLIKKMESVGAPIIVNHTIKKPIKFYVKKLLKIVEQMHVEYPQKKFTLDGRLVGDIGEILAAEKYLIELNEGLTKHHDAICIDGTNRKVQIKATMKESLTFPCDHVPDNLLGIKIHKDGSIEEIYNGPGDKVKELIIKWKISKTNLHLIPIKKLKILNKEIIDTQRIPERKNNQF